MIDFVGRKLFLYDIVLYSSMNGKSVIGNNNNNITLLYQVIDVDACSCKLKLYETTITLNLFLSRIEKCGNPSLLCKISKDMNGLKPNDIGYINRLNGNTINAKKKSFGEIFYQSVSIGDLVLVFDDYNNKYMYGLIVGSNLVFLGNGLYLEDIPVFKIKELDDIDKDIKNILISKYQKYSQEKLLYSKSQNVGDVYTSGKGYIYYLYLGECEVLELVSQNGEITTKIVSKLYNGKYHLYLKFNIKNEGNKLLEDFKKVGSKEEFIKSYCRVLEKEQSSRGVDPALNGLVGYKKLKSFDKKVCDIDMTYFPNEILFISWNNHVQTYDKNPLDYIINYWKKRGLTMRCYKLYRGGNE